MRGYKIFGPDYTCRGYKYSLDSPNIYSGEIKACTSGFHYCPVAVNCLQYYDFKPENTYAEVECGDEYTVEDDKIVCKELRIVKTLTFDEFRELATGKINNLFLNCSYVDGKQHGSYKRWWHKDQLKLETTYVNGKLHGNYKEWYENGKLFAETNYIDGKQHGISREWDLNGELSVENTYVDGKIQGCKMWHKIGQLRLEVGIIDGKWNWNCTTH